MLIPKFTIFSSFFQPFIEKCEFYFLVQFFLFFGLRGVPVIFWAYLGSYFFRILDQFFTLISFFLLRTTYFFPRSENQDSAIFIQKAPIFCVRDWFCSPVSFFSLRIANCVSEGQISEITFKKIKKYIQYGKKSAQIKYLVIRNSLIIIINEILAKSHQH